MMIRQKSEFKCRHDLLEVWEWMEGAFIKECVDKGIDPDDFGEIDVSFSVAVKQKRKPEPQEN